MNQMLLINGAAIAGLMFGTWLVSLRLRDASVVDVVWGMGFVLVAWIGFALADGPLGRKLLVAGLVTIWGVRLSVHMFRLRRGHGEDFRYRAMRARHGRRFPLVSLFTVYGFQAVGMWAVSLPVQAAQQLPSPSGITALDLIGVGLWSVGMVFEVGGDRQLARFRANPANRGKVMDQGLWRYTRHPNYFGDFCVWWGLFVVALAAEGAFWEAIAGPLTMTLIFTKVFGVPLMEEHLSRAKDGYAEYVRRTSAFFPCPPRSG